MPHMSRAKLQIISRMPMMVKSTVVGSNVISNAHLYKMMLLTGNPTMLVMTDGMYFFIFIDNPI